MRIIIALFLLASFSLQAQEKTKDKSNGRSIRIRSLQEVLSLWLADLQKDLMKHLQFNYKIFEKTFPGANKQWFDPQSKLEK